MSLSQNVEELIRYLDYAEVSNHGKKWHPIKIFCSDEVTLSRVNELVDLLRTMIGEDTEELYEEVRRLFAFLEQEKYGLPSVYISSTRCLMTGEIYQCILNIRDLVKQHNKEEILF